MVSWREMDSTALKWSQLALEGKPVLCLARLARGFCFHAQILTSKATSAFG